jgi:hypothetical protein
MPDAPENRTVNIGGEEVASPPFRYNTSSWSQRVPICALALVGCGTATYMGLYQWGVIDSVWDPVFGEQSVNVLRSPTSLAMERWTLIPDAILGAFAYLGDAVYGLAGSTRRWQLRPWMTLLFGFDVIPLGVVSVVLVFMQGAVVGYWCFLCIFTAFISAALVYVAYDEIWSCLKYLRHAWKEGDRTLFWDIFWGKGSERAARMAIQYAKRENVNAGVHRHVAANC